MNGREIDAAGDDRRGPAWRARLAGLAMAALFLCGGAASADESDGPAEVTANLLDNGSVAGETFDSVCCGPGKPTFSDAPSPVIRTRYGGGSIWARINFGDEPGVLVLDSMVDLAELYIRDPSTGQVRVSRAGDMLPVSVREIVAPKLAFPIREADLGKDIYVRILQETMIPVRFHHYSTTAFDRATDRTNLWRALFLGAVLVMVLYNAVVSYVVRDLAFLFNAGSIFGLLTLDVYLTGVGAAYLWGEFPWASNLVLNLSLASAIICAGLFFYYFLSDGNVVRAKDTRLLLAAPLLAAPTLASGIALPYWIVQLLLLILAAATLLIFFGFVLMRSWRGDVRARILLVPLGVAMIPGLTLVAAQRVFGVELTFVRDHLLEVVLFLEAMLFSLALAYRIRIARDQTARAHSAYVMLEREGNARLLRAVDHERSRIAAELHDTAGQGLLAISNRLSRLAHHSSVPSSLQSEIAESEGFSRAIVDDIRRISHDLHPATLDQLGLKQALSQLVRQVKENTPIDTHFSYDLDGKTLPPADAVHLFRIVQELVTNVVKHANATACVVSLTTKNDQVNLGVIDNGRGCDARRPSGGNHIGLDVVRRRVQALSGTMTIADAAPGTEVRIAFPLTSGSSARVGQ